MDQPKSQARYVRSIAASRDRQKGQISMVVYFLFALAVMAFSITIIERNIEQRRANATGAMLQTLVTASSQYLNAEAQTLTADLTLGGPAVAIPLTNSDGFSAPDGLPSVQAAGFLPAGYSDLDAFDQSHALLVREVSAPTASNPEASYQAYVVSYAGEDIPDPLDGSIIEQSNGQGGFVPSYETGVPTIYGAFGTWQVGATALDNNTASNKVQVKPGHYAATLQFQPQVSSLSDYLDRYSVAGTTEPNTMHAPIYMAGNNVQNASAVTFSGGGGVSGNAGTLYLAPDGSLSGGSFVPTNGGTVEISGNLTTNGNVTVTGNQTVSGSETAGSVTAGSAAIANQLSVGGNISVAGGASIGGNFSANGPATVSGTLNANSVSATSLATANLNAGDATVSGDETVGNDLYAQHVVPQANATPGGSCSYPGEIAYDQGQGIEVFCQSTPNGNQYVGWDGGSQITISSPISYSTSGSYTVASPVGAPSCMPGEQAVEQTSASSNTPPSSFSPNTDFVFVCGTNGTFQPVSLPTPPSS